MEKDKTFLHLDMDAFYASVEQAENPDLIGKAVIIGAKPGNRGVVSACSYEARKYGVHSAMPISEAYRLCPKGIYIPPDIKKYQIVSNKIMEMLTNYSPVVQQISIDEAFMDITGTERLLGTAVELAENIKKDVYKQMNQTISIGIANNKFLAKIASDFNKPDGLVLVDSNRAIEFIDKLKLKDLWGLGKKTLIKLNNYNINDIKSLRSINIDDLKRLMGEAGGTYLYKAVRGIDPGIYNSVRKSKSISSERTFNSDTNNMEILKSVLLDISHQIMFRMIDSAYYSKTVCLKLRYSDFSSFTNQITLKHDIESAEEIYKVSLELLKDKLNKNQRLRLIGIGLSNLKKEKNFSQKELLEDEYNKKKKVENTVYNLKNKIKDTKITKASLLKKKDLYD